MICGTQSLSPRSAGPRERGRGAQAGEGPAAGLAASTCGGAAGGGVGGAEEGLSREVPGWSQPPGAERFSCPAGSALRTGEVSQKKMPGAPQGLPGAARSRCSVRDAPPPPPSAIGLRGLGAAPLETLAAAGTPGGSDWTAGQGSAARRRVGAGGGGERRGCVRCGRGAGARSPEGRDSGPADRASSGCRRVGKEGRGPVGSGRGRFQGWARCWVGRGLGPPGVSRTLAP